MNIERKENHAKSGHRVRLYNDGQYQSLHIPKDLELPGDEAIIQKKGKQLIIKPQKKPSLLKTLAGMKKINEDFPDFDQELLPPDDIEI
jgi:antitoxin VapB